MNPEWTTFLAAQGFTADGASQFEHFGPLDAELQAARNGTVITPMADLGLIRASGADAVSFLHNLMTNDIQGIAETNASTAGFCTPKGRLLAIFLVWRENNDYLLMLPKEILPPLLKKLSMYVLRAKVKLTDATDERALIGISVPAAVSPAPTFLDGTLPRQGVSETDGGQLIRLDDTRWLLSLDPIAAIRRWPDITVNATATGLAAWHWLEIAAGQPRVTIATQEVFVPQMLNLELPAVAGVSFTKGCYPGQEIVARTHYLGKVKRRMVRARLTNLVAPGTHVYAPEAGDQQCGALVSIAPSPEGGFECLVSVQSSAVAAGDVRLGAPDGERLTFLPLPYTLN
ncbi:MAG: folate-binding protein [Pseudomonadota bacterium]